MNKILSIVIGAALLSAQVASAQVTEADLMATGMPALQAETVYDLAQQGPADDLAIGGDAITFAAAGTIASTGSGNDITLNSADTVVLRAAGDANRILTWSAASDTALKLLLGDATTLQSLDIAANSSDAADDDRLTLSGGGTFSADRGAYIFLQGNEYTGGGDAEFFAGSAAGSNMQLGTAAASGTVGLFAGAATAHTTLGAASATALTMLFGAAATATQEIVIAPLSSDAADNDRICLASGGACDASGTRGAILRMAGNEYSSGADVDFYAGAASGSNMSIGTIASNGIVTFVSGAATTAMTIEADQDIVVAGTFTSSETGSLGWSIVAGADTACNTTCTSACVFGWDSGAAGVLLACSDATSDSCLCAGAT